MIFNLSDANHIKLSAGLSFTHYVWVFVYIVFYGSCFEGNRGENLICNPLISVKE